MGNPEQKIDMVTKERRSNRESQEDLPEREGWGHQMEFIFAMVGYSVGLGNVWRFPYLCYRNGGGAFLLVYLFVMLLGGIPMFFLEVSLGQYTKLSAIQMWKRLPSMKGIGFGCTWVNMIFSTYNMVVMAWSVYYLVHSFIPGPLPWTTCDNWWNTPNCSRTMIKKSGQNASILLSPLYNGSRSLLNHSSSTNGTNVVGGISPEAEFWRRNVLQQSAGLEDMGTITNWGLVGCFLVSWVVIYLCIFKGARWSGKVVYVTSTLPYVFLFILFVRGVTLEGAGEGIMYLIKPNFTKLGDAQVWVDAGGQIFFSYGICFTVLITFGSFNKFNNNCYKQCMVLASTCSITSLFSSLVIFGLLGHMAFVQEKDISEVATSGPGLVFLVYPVGLSLLPLPHVWSVIFFATLFLVGVDTQFASVEGCVTTLSDVFPRLKRGKHSQERLTGCVSLFLMLLGIPLLTNGGIYLFELLNMYAASGISLLFLVFFEALAIGWMYDSERFYENIRSMVGYYPNPYFKYCYKFFTPAIAVFILGFYILNYRPLVLDEYVYPPWANAVGWMLSLTSMLCVPGFFLLEVYRQPGSITEKLRGAVKIDVSSEKSGSLTPSTSSSDNQELPESVELIVCKA